ncbi:MAG: transglycosylase domain-containing protein [Candidatus Nealsonbacteria bacterium]
MAKRKHHKKIYSRTGKKKKKQDQQEDISKLVNLFFFGFILAVFLSLSLFFYYVKDFPRPEIFNERQLAQSTKIYDRNGQTLLYEIYGEEKRTWVSLEFMPEQLKQAVIAAEDANFYNHFGVDIRGIIRAVLADLKIRQPIYGGSTIPQQLIRSTFLSTEKTAERKIREIVMALELNRRYSKDKILEWYLNQVPFGQNAYGAEAASQTYFDKSVSEISLSEAAILAALIQAPSRLSPYGENKEQLLIRKDYVLNRMTSERFIDKETASTTKAQEIIFVEKPVRMKAPYFTLWVKQQLEKKYGEDYLRRMGLRVYTSLDWELQQEAEKITKQGIEINKAHNAHNAGAIVISPQNGEVLAMTVGTGNYYDAPYPEGCVPGKDCLFDPRFNVVVGTQRNPGRQPGSAFKPFVYATAFKQGYDDKYTVIDEPTNFGVWGEEEYEPQNYDEFFRGEVNLRQCLAQSLNVPSVKVLLDLAGLENSIKTAQSLGINTLNPPYGPSIVLGGWEVKLIEMTSAYGVLANDGLKIPPVSILKIEDSKGNIIEQNKKTPQRVLETNAVRLVNSILSDNNARAPMFGFSSLLYFRNFDVAAKTGTTQDYRDAWTIGYTPSVVIGVWAGNNNNESMKEEPGIVLAGPIFNRIMNKVIWKFPKQDFPKPETTLSQTK